MVTIFTYDSNHQLPLLFFTFFYEYKNCPNADTDLAVISIESEKHSAMFNASSFFSFFFLPLDPHIT